MAFIFVCNENPFVVCCLVNFYDAFPLISIPLEQAHCAASHLSAMHKFLTLKEPSTYCSPNTSQTLILIYNQPKHSLCKALGGKCLCVGLSLYLLSPTLSLAVIIGSPLFTDQFL